MNKRNSRLRRSLQTRARISLQKMNRLTVYRSNCHIYASLLNPENRILLSVSTLQKEVVAELKDIKPATVASAAVVGKLLAEKARSIGIEKVAFDRSGYRYHGKVKALAEAARQAGLLF